MQSRPSLPKSSVTYIVEWAQGQTTQALNKPHFSPLLNAEDLSADCVLPSLLRTRAGLHPVHFHSGDGRLVVFRYFTGTLDRAPTAGTLTFEADENNEYYRINLQKEPTSKDDHLSTRSPRIALSEFEVQLATYEFLASFPLYFLDHYDCPHINDVGIPATDASILDHFARPAYGRIDCIDLENVRSLVAAALEETQENFVRLRKRPRILALMYHANFDNCQRDEDIKLPLPDLQYYSGFHDAWFRTTQI